MARRGAGIFSIIPCAQGVTYSKSLATSACQSKPLPYHLGFPELCNLYSITTNQAAIVALFRVINHYVGNLPPMPGVFPDYPAPVIRNTDTGTEMMTMR